MDTGGCPDTLLSPCPWSGPCNGAVLEVHDCECVCVRVCVGGGGGGTVCVQVRLWEESVVKTGHALLQGVHDQSQQLRPLVKQEHQRLA